jgi:Protein of unknown function (DUF1566)
LIHGTKRFICARYSRNAIFQKDCRKSLQLIFGISVGFCFLKRFLFGSDIASESSASPKSFLIRKVLHMYSRWGIAKQCVSALLLGGWGLAGSAYATLISRGPDLVYDNVLNITWTRNANVSGSSVLTWGKANDWAANLVYAGYDDWRLPYANVSAGPGPVPQIIDCSVATELQCRDNEMGYMFYYHLAGLSGSDRTGTQTAVGGEKLTEIQGLYWSGTEFVAGSDAWGINFGFGLQGNASSNFQLSGWAVRSGDVRVTVPEPQTYGLLFAGLGLLRWRAHRRYGNARLIRRDW